MSGFSGYSGISGFSGYSGISGRSGASGISGFSGLNTVYTKSYSFFMQGNGNSLATPSNAANVLGFVNWTIELWIYRTGVNTLNANSNMFLFDYRQATGTNNISLFFSGAEKRLNVQTGETRIIISTIDIELFQWYHIAIVKNNNSTRLYINGVQDGVSADTRNYGSNRVTVGSRFSLASGNSLSWNGYISNLRIVRGIGLYTSNFAVPTSPLEYIPSTNLLTANMDVFTGVIPTGNISISKFNPFGENIVSSMTPTFTTVSTNTINTQNLNFTGSGAVAITSANDLQFNAAGWIALQSPLTLPSKTLSQLNSLTNVPAGTILICTNTSGGAKPVWYNGTVWKDMLNGSI